MKTETATLVEPQEAGASLTGLITMQTWANPVNFRVLGQSIGDHTWVVSATSSPVYCADACFGVRPDPAYCDLKWWQSGTYAPPTSTCRKLNTGTASNTCASCIAGQPYRFMMIPSQSGIVYAINGVCHQFVNRILYPSGLTVAGANSYWLSQFLYGTYGTMIPWALIPPVLAVPFFPFLIPNPLFAVAVAHQRVMSSQWAEIRGRCVGAGTMALAPDAGGRYLQAVQQLHAQPLATRTAATGQELSDLVGLQYERHMQEMDLTLEYRGAGISPSKLADLRALLSEFHKPSPDLAAEFDKQMALPAQDVALSSGDALLLSQVSNGQAGELLKKTLDILGPQDFATFFEHKPEEAFLVIDPRTLGFNG